MPAPSPEAVKTLLDDIREQYERRVAMFASAGGDPKRIAGSLTAYLDYDMLRAVFGVPKP